MSNGGNGKAAVGAVQQTGVQQPQLRGSNKPSPFVGTFEQYQAELELYLGDRDAWSMDHETGEDLSIIGK
ncbi:uncharacterized protein PITG_03249 [Phytophthora infestans T30-4]|uniref:Uncharacterized protein n=1 Tax=Phytophthora infestans (strain T30-4) TaxID=403677 RepID=D0MZR5_PHYIT|nr:uncharacterized protein PITG_03249 [Phytophthora infestans T30-4]EEY65728.1 hypothetical protein PITG_03249 [Phytophthora infestans T30-4]|eukprot:XP_002906327.1 hypothetical protein PITG_03249 [Phytophthora infestans T30-4]